MSLDYLAKLNAHPRDAFIQFDEPTHVYTVHGDKTFMSVTTWNHHHFPKFDADKIIKQIISSKKHKEDPTYKYYQMTAGQIMDMWNANRDGASSAGTNMHYDIECFYNQMDVSNDSIEYKYFQNFLRENPHLHPYRTEWTIYHEELKIAGSVDMVYQNPNGTLLIYDWKRCRDIVKENAYGSTATTECIRHLPDTNFWHYALQLNTYKTIIEEKYGMKVVGLCLVCLHPNNENYQLIEVPFMPKEMTDLFEYRREMLKAQLAQAGKAQLAQAGKAHTTKKASDQTNAKEETKSIASYFKPVKNSIRTADLHSSRLVTDNDSNPSTEGADLNLHRFKPATEKKGLLINLNSI